MAAVEDENPTSSSTTTFSKEEVNKLLAQGKRHFVCDEIVEAVKCFEAACLMLNKKYGALSNECGDAHFLYGKSLLELSRLESGVLGSAIKEVIEGEEPVDSDEETDVDKCGAENAAGTTQIDEEKPGDEKSEGSSQEKMDEEKTKNNIENKSTDNNNASGTTQNNEEKVESEKPEGSSQEKMDEDETENKIEKNDNKDYQKEEKTTGTNEEKPAVEKTEESRQEKTTEDECSNNKDDSNQENDSKVVSRDTSKSNKESMDEEQKEVDEGVGENGEHRAKEEGQNEDMEGQEDENKSTLEEKDEGTDDKDEDINDEETTDEGSVSTIQLAWESLELARIIFKRYNNTEIQLKLAQTHLLLGEIHMEQEQFSDAVSELTKCLNIQKNLLKPDDRLLAETYYNLGLAYSLSMMYDESASHYENATGVLELRIKNTKARIEEVEQQDKGKGKASDDDPLVKDRKELADLEDLLPEVKEKCLDAKNESERLKTNIKEKLGLTSAGVGNTSFASCSSSCSDKPANDISHLVRKQKRKPKDEEESAENSEAPAKKPRQDSDSTTQAENGDSTSAALTGVENLS